MSEARWTVVDIDASLIEETGGLFQRVFGHPLSEALWRWKYDEGRGVGVGARAPGGELLAHYGGTFRQVFFCGRPALAVQISDVMVAQEGRAALAHKGPFGMVVQAFLKRHVGVAHVAHVAHVAGAASGPVIGFGFPNARHMRLGERLGHYVQVDKILELTWHVEGNFDGSKNRGLHRQTQALDWADPTTAIKIDALWRDMKQDLCELIVPARNAAWFRHRYANHPEHKYVCFWVRSRWTRRVIGALVLRPHLATNPTTGVAQTWELIDWVAPLSKTELMLQAALAVVGEQRGGVLMGWFSSSVAKTFATAATQTNDACTAGVTAPSVEAHLQITDSFRPAVSDLRGKWWLTGGDTDFR